MRLEGFPRVQFDFADVEGRLRDIIRADSSSFPMTIEGTPCDAWLAGVGIDFARQERRVYIWAVVREQHLPPLTAANYNTLTTAYGLGVEMDSSGQWRFSRYSLRKEPGSSRTSAPDLEYFSAVFTGVWR